MDVTYPTGVNVSSNPASSTAPPRHSLPGVSDISALFQNLVKAGVVTAPAAPIQPPPNLSLSSLTSLSQMLATGFPSVKSEPEHAGVTVDPGVMAEREYERMLLSLQVTLTTSGLQKYVSALRYHHVSLTTVHQGPTPSCRIPL